MQDTTRLRRGLFMLLALLNAFALNAQERYTISGYLTDAESGEKLISARVYDALSAKGTLSNNFGFFSLSLPAGEVQLVAGNAGFQTYKQIINLQADTVINISLAAFTVDEVVIVAEDERALQERTEMSTVDIPIKQIKMLPALLGEVDVIKAIQLMPGVQSGSEGATGLYVRGGGPDQNLILLDDVPLPD
ncbi:MAG: carboxypeptidase-like regulatory domain-containing protein [Bacteroidota bacterium]